MTHYAQWDPHNDFLRAIRASGLEPPDSLEPGQLYRFPGTGKSPNNRAGWCVLFNDEAGGSFGDWSTGMFETWHRTSEIWDTESDRKRRIHHAREARAQAEAARTERHARAATKANEIWGAAGPAPVYHPYLTRKRINAHGARHYKGTLVLPIMNVKTQLTSLQFIREDGTKRLLTGGRKQGCFIPVNTTHSGTPKVIVCEGWATGCTLSEHEPSALVIAAIDAGNLKSIALAARHFCPSGELLIAGDDDRLTPGNPGATKAKEAAAAADALLALPDWPPDAPESLSDFNDLAVWSARKRL